MRGIERRSEGPGRRKDGAAGRRDADRRLAAPPSWIRILILAVTLAVAAYVLLVAREVTQPTRELNALQARLLETSAGLAAERLDARLEAASAALAEAASAPSAVAVRRARALSPRTAFAVLTPEGAVVAAEGAEADAFAAAAPRADLDTPRLSGDRRALLLARERPDGGRLVARIAAPDDLEPGQAVVSDRDGVVMGAAEWIGRAAPQVFGVDKAGLLTAETGGLPDAPLALAAAPVGETGLVAVASRPLGASAGGLLDDAWILITPLALGGAVILLVLAQRWRQARARQAWLDSERRFRIAVEAANCGVWEWDVQNETVSLSDSMAEMLGFAAGGAVSADAVMARIHPRYRPMVEHALHQAEVLGAFEVTFPVPDGQGRTRWIDARGQSRGRRSEDGAFAILGIALDITEARRAKAQAQAAENRLRDGIESVSDAFVLFDRQGRLILWNQAFIDAFGFETGVVRPGALKDELNRIAALAIKSDHPAAGGRAGAREVELHDGRWLQLSERFTSDGGSVVTAADITALKRKEAERRQATDHLRTMVVQLEASQDKLSQLARQYEVAMTRAEAANQAKSEFLANMSHELRTPLNAINGFSEIMAAEMFGPLGDARYKGYAGDILRSGQHLLSLINDILDMAKIEAGKLTLHYETVDLVEICEDAARLMRGKVEEARLTLALDAPDMPEIEADHRGLKQVMLNLISNAIKFTPEGGDITVSVRLLPDERVRVAVTDTGIGIAPDDLARLTRPFEQVEGQHSKTTQGTGLGLALTRSLVELHQGTLTMESEPGVGTTVSFDLPLRRPAAEATPEARAA